MQRLAALRSYEVLDTACEEAFDGLVHLAAQISGCPIAAISLIDDDRQWFKARHGIAAAETPRDEALCAHAVLQPGEPLCVPDARIDPRFSDNPAVMAGEVVSYLGVPLVTPDGQAIGTLCVADRRPRLHDERVVEGLCSVARATLATLEVRRALRHVHGVSLTDPLTGLANRRAVMHRLAEALRQGRGAAVIAVHLDRLKAANDVRGDAAGDALLHAAAERIRAAVRAGDVVGRTGRDEFLVVLPAIADAAAAAEIAGRIGTRVSAPVLHEGRALLLGATFGVALAPADADDPAVLARIADEALTRAKRARRGRISRGAACDAARVTREAAIILALEEVAEGHLPGLAAHLQPIVDLRSGAATGAEALARWHHPRLGPVPPTEMFAVAARSGRADCVSRLVRAMALETFAALRREGLAPNRLAVNLSAAEMLRPDVVEVLEAQVSAAGLDMSSIVIEITEDTVLDRVAHATLGRLAALRDRGARIALDDFGTGTSGLAQLLSIPLDVVKLDAAFIRKLGTDARAEKIVAGAIRLAHSMDLAVTAEGIEEERQAALLLGMGCDFGQGWHFARPMADAELRSWLVARREAAAPFDCRRFAVA
jgi:diguanylate cyclase (GGDEF)-like protein